jgi:hypothetical protein
MTTWFSCVSLLSLLIFRDFRLPHVGKPTNHLQIHQKVSAISGRIDDLEKRFTLSPEMMKENLRKLYNALLQYMSR